jgi:hypothetical protein
MNVASEMRLLFVLGVVLLGAAAILIEIAAVWLAARWRASRHGAPDRRLLATHARSRLLP